jgi:hypothetical protein
LPGKKYKILKFNELQNSDHNQIGNPGTKRKAGALRQAGQHENLELLCFDFRHIAKPRTVNTPTDHKLKNNVLTLTP